MIVGSIFPQGYGPETYISSWGEEKYALFSKFGLLNLFHSKYFLILGLILLLNLVFCSVIRWMRRGGGMSFGPPSHARSLKLAGGAGAAKKTPRRQGLQDPQRVG